MCLEWRDKNRCLLAFRYLECGRARRGALPGPSELAASWQSVAVEAECLGCGGGTCVRGEASWIRVSAAHCPRDPAKRKRPRKIRSRRFEGCHTYCKCGVQIHTSLTITWGADRRLITRVPVLQTLPTIRAHHTRLCTPELQGRLEKLCRVSKDACNYQRIKARSSGDA